MSAKRSWRRGTTREGASRPPPGLPPWDAARDAAWAAAAAAKAAARDAARAAAWDAAWDAAWAAALGRRLGRRRAVAAGSARPLADGRAEDWPLDAVVSEAAE